MQFNFKLHEDGAIMAEVTYCTSHRQVHYVIETVVASFECTNETA